MGKPTNRESQMATLAEINKQIAELQKKAEALRRSEVAEAVAQIKSLVERYGLTAADVGLAGKAGNASKARVRASASKPVGVPKYQDPKTSKSWTGVGKPPAWIAGKKNRDAFLIKGPVSLPPTAPEPATKRAAPKKSAVATAVKARHASMPAKKAIKTQPASSTKAALKAKTASATGKAATAVEIGTAPEATAAA